MTRCGKHLKSDTRATRGRASRIRFWGEGPHDLIFVPGFVSQLELAWEEPHLARFLRELVSVDQNRYLARHIPGARFIELGGVDHWPWIGDSDAVIAEIESFVLGKRRSRGPRHPWGPDALTKREREVAELAVRGLSAREISERLVISERTAESHVANIYVKLGVGSRVELVVGFGRPFGASVSAPSLPSQCPL